MSEYINAAEIYLRLALKAQAQCRTTVETLVEMKNPRPVAFVSQANISNGPQQVNNATPLAGTYSRAGNFSNPSNGGGLHYVFRHVPGIRNSASKIGNGLDIRGDGGYIVAPPSIHERPSLCLGRRKFVDPRVALELVICWNSARCQPPLEHDEIVRTVASVCRKERVRRAEAGR